VMAEMGGQCREAGNSLDGLPIKKAVAEKLPIE